MNPPNSNYSRVDRQRGSRRVLYLYICWIVLLAVGALGWGWFVGYVAASEGWLRAMGLVGLGVGIGWCGGELARPRGWGRGRVRARRLVIQGSRFWEEGR